MTKRLLYCKSEVVVVNQKKNLVKIWKKLYQRSWYHEKNGSENLTLLLLIKSGKFLFLWVKLCHNKKCQKFVGLLIFWIFFFHLNQTLLQKKSKKWASHQTFGSSYFVRALVTVKKHFWNLYKKSRLTILVVLFGHVTSEQTRLLGSELAQLKIVHFIYSTPPATYPTFTATSLLIQLIFSHYIHTTQLGGKSEFFSQSKNARQGAKG